MLSLREARFKASMTQGKIFQKTHIYPSRYSYIERGIFNARRDEREKIARALNCSVSDIAWPTDQQAQVEGGDIGDRIR